jgi:hypothetical protein
MGGYKMSEFKKEIYRRLRRYPGQPFKLPVDGIDVCTDSVEDKINFLLSKDQNVSPPPKKVIAYTGLENTLIQYCVELYNEAIARMNGKLSSNFKVNDNWSSYTNFYNSGLYLDYLDDLLYLGIWDDGFANDPENRKSPLGKLFLHIQKYKGNEPVGIIQAAEQQSTHKHRDDLIKAQKLAADIYCKFLAYFHEKPPGENSWDAETEEKYKAELKHPPIVQLCNCGASALLCGLPTPAFILMDEKEIDGKEDKFSGFSALPHECGHVLAHSIHGAELLKEIWKKVELALEGLIIPEHDHK